MKCSNCSVWAPVGGADADDGVIDVLGGGGELLGDVGPDPGQVIPGGGAVTEDPGHAGQVVVEGVGHGHQVPSSLSRRSAQRPVASSSEPTRPSPAGNPPRDTHTE